MANPRTWFIAVLLATLTVVEPAHALTAESLKIAQESTALLHASSYRLKSDVGAAFCIDRSGLFIATSRAANWVSGGSLQLVLSSGISGERSYDATIIRNDPNLNLSLLKIAAANDFIPLEIGDSHHLSQETDVTTFDYALRRDIRDRIIKCPPIAVKPCRITELKDRFRGRDTITCDANLSWEQSGVPVIDDSGKVVGIVEREVLGSNHSATFMPTDRIRKFLDAPQVALATTTLPYDQRHVENKLTVSVTTVMKPAPAYEAELNLQIAGAPAQTISAHVINDSATFGFIPIAPLAKTPGTLTAQFSRGSITGVFVDQKIRVGDQSVLLHDVRRIERAVDEPVSTVTLVGGVILRGKVSGLESISLNLSTVSNTVDLSRTHSISVQDPDFTARHISYVVRVRLRGLVVGQASGMIELAGAPRPLPGEMPLVLPVATTSNVVPPGGTSKTQMLGGKGGNPMELCSSPPRDVIGFRYAFAVWQGRGIVRTLTPLYGHEDVNLNDTITARDGYVVGGLMVDSDKYFHAFRVMFMKTASGNLSSDEGYLSDWIGEPSSGEPPKQLAGNGSHVVGVCGRKGLNMDAVGLVLTP